MRTPVISPRVATLAVGLALATSMLSTPATADESTTTMSAAALPRIGELDAYVMADWQRVAQDACFASGVLPEIDSVTYAQSGGNVEALLISAAVDRDGNQELDATCTFAVIATRADTGEQYGNFLSDGTWHLKAGESGGSSFYGKEGSIQGSPTVITSAIFTEVDRYAVAELRASGNHMTSTATTVVVPARAKSASHVLRAKSQRDRAIKSAKKTYGKAKKKAAAIKNAKKRAAVKSKAKKAYKRAVELSKALYARQLLPSPATTRVDKTPVPTRFSLRLSIDD